VTGKAYHAIFEDEWLELKSRISFATTYKEHWPSLIPLFEQISQQNAVFIMIWNMVTNRIIYHIDKRGIIGYPSSRYLADDGVNFTMSNAHPEFIQSAIKQQQCAIKYFTDVCKEVSVKMIVNLESVSKKITGKYIHFLQQTVAIETDSDGNPFLFLSYVHDIGHIKKENTANMIITMPGKLMWWNFNFERNCLEPVKLLSKQEKVILSCLAEGKSSKEIAEKLHISSFTVDTHRKNLLKKTNCIDTTGMVTYARLVGLI
jgi:DNA-binding CsgD family transcriptional regulator